MKEYLYKTRGFTYIELLIVVGIMLIFGAFLVASVNPVERIKAQRDSQRESDLNSILLSVQQKIKNDRGWDCLSEPLPQDQFTAIGTGSGEYDLYSCLLPNYLSKYLVDPKEGSIAGSNITDGLVGHWKFNERSGTTAYDASGNGNDGTLVSDPVWVDGKMGKALDFDGVDDYVDCGNDDSLNITDAITLEAWVKQKENNDGYVIMKNNADDSKRFYSIYSRGTANEIYFLYYDGAKKEIIWNYALDDNTWHNVVITVSGTTAKLYVDEAFQGDKTLAGAFQGDVNAKVKIGRRDPNGVYFNGLIDDVRIYNRALSPEEIQDLYNYEYSSKYAIWQNPVTKNISLKSLEDETKEVSTGAPELALNFDGENDYVATSLVPNYNTGYSLSFWAKMKPYAAQLSAIMGDSGGASSSYGVSVWQNSDGKMRVYSSKGTAGIYNFILNGVTNVNDEKFHHIVVTWTGDTTTNGAKLYVDKVLENQATAVTAITGINVFNIGKDGSTHKNISTIDEVRIYNRALSAEEVEQLYKGYDIRSGLVGHWPLNEGTGTTAYDRSGNNNNGTLFPAGDGPTWTTK